MDPVLVDAFIRSLAHRERVEVGANVMKRGCVTEVAYASPLAWPWPRQFAYTREFFARGATPEVLASLREAAVEGRDHVLDLFSDDPDACARDLVQAGYVLAWVSSLLGRSLATRWCRPRAGSLPVHEVASPADMERHASVQGISNPGIARDPAIHNFFSVLGDEVVAKGQLVLLPGRIAYISDMFTSESYRRRGYCNAMMCALESKASALGATHACLAPGREVASYGLYENYGYSVVGRRAVLIPGEGNRAA